MIAKLIVHRDTREEAAAGLAEACAEVEVWPVKTNAGFLTRCLRHPRFVEGDVDTGLIEAEGDALTRGETPAFTDAAALAALLLRRHSRESLQPMPQPDPMSPWRPNPYDEPATGSFGFRLNAPAEATIAVHQGGRRIVGRAASAGADGGDPVWRITDASGSSWEFAARGGVYAQSLKHDGRRIGVSGREDVLALHLDGDTFVYIGNSPRGVAGGTTSDGALRAPMPGKIVATPAKPGDTVTKGQPVVVLEAMKMEHALVAPFDGIVGAINVGVGDQVTDGAVLAVVEGSAG